MLHLACEAQRAAGHEGERLRLHGQDFVRRGFAAVFLDRRILDVAGRADQGDDSVAVGRNVGNDRRLQRAGLRVEDAARKLAGLHAIGERGGQLDRLRRNCRGKPGREAVESCARLFDAVKFDREHQTATRLYGCSIASTGAGSALVSYEIVSWPPIDFELSPIRSAERKRYDASSSAACATSCGA